MLLILLLLTTLWAVVATIMVVKNPLPFPDRGHRLFAVRDERARTLTLSILAQIGLLPRFRFRTGPSDQTLLWDNTTVIHLLDPESGVSGNGISLVVKDPEQSAKQAISILTSAGYTATRLPGIDGDLPPNHLVIVSSDAFSGWGLAFRRHQLRMPKPTFVEVE